MRIAQVENGVVVNVIDVNPNQWPGFATGWPQAGDAGPGWVVDGDEFEPPAALTPTADMVREERQRRVMLGLSHRSKLWQIDLESRNLIGGAVQGASLFLAGGGAGTDLRWRSADTDATWTAFDNSTLTFTPNEMIAFGLAVLAHIGALHDAARVIQALDPIPADYNANERWP